MAGFVVAPDDLTGEDVLALLSLHLERMHKWSPADKVHALPPEKLRVPGVSFFAARASGELAGVGALKALAGASGEIKSMRAADAWRGRGAGKAILLALLTEAQARGYLWVALETGGHPESEAAHLLYAAHGFRECPPFGDYVSDDFSLCMRLELG